MKSEKSVKILTIFAIIFLTLSAASWGIKTYFMNIGFLPLTPAADMERAVLLFDATIQHPQAVIVLAPGLDSKGYNFLLDNKWRDFARNNNLGLIVLSFANSDNNNNSKNGYYYVEKGSGELLLNGIREIYGQELPLLMYGFSGGAHFVSRFAQWRPEQVLAWGAYSAAWWDEPKMSDSNPPGVVACGELDERFMASLKYFQQGRRIGKPWLWVGIKNLDHEMSPQLEEFMRNYFQAVIDNSTGLWFRGNDTEELDIQSEQQAPNSVWFPAESLIEKWNKVKNNN